MFNRKTCKRCGVCLMLCPFLELPKQQAEEEMAQMIETMESKIILKNCAGCSYCDIICPTQSNPSHLRKEILSSKSSNKGMACLSLITDEVPFNLMTIGLEFDPEEWWYILRTQNSIPSSGHEDELPKNRFLKKPPTKKIILAVIALIILSYFGFRFSKIFGRPEITITYPQGEGPLVSTSPEITLKGTLKNGDKILIGNEEITLASDSSWEKTVPLTSSTPNNIEITAKKFLGRESKITLQILYEPPVETGKKNVTPATPTSSPTSTEKSSE